MSPWAWWKRIRSAIGLLGRMVPPPSLPDLCRGEEPDQQRHLADECKQGRVEGVLIGQYAELWRGCERHAAVLGSQGHLSELADWVQWTLTDQWLVDGLPLPWRGFRAPEAPPPRRVCSM